MSQNKSKDFNVYYLNFTKVYEIAMMINNVILTKIENDRTKSFEEQYGFTSSISAQGTKKFLDGIKASISADAKETSFSSSRVIETLDVKTTKSILLRRVIEQCSNASTLEKFTEGDLVKVDNVKLELLDEESLRQFLILRRDALKGVRIEGMELNNLVGSMLQDYAYILKGTVYDNAEESVLAEIIIKIPLEIQSEFENKYSINDLLIGHVSIVGIYKGIVKEEFISSNTFTYFQEIGMKQKQSTESTSKIIKSATYPPDAAKQLSLKAKGKEYYFLDTLAIIQDVTFNFEEPQIPKLHWWNRLGIWLSKLRRD
ncbi:hypothetical protein [Faecalispora jeddahensis]|uniref:hypothetical protein n=1 Tax=Faecalispora jeddahensis TaxID=1414721 RepID=UPI0027B9EDCA|nr:hypothetical protein [Faecalispora jeddahensis]